MALSHRRQEMKELIEQRIALLRSTGVDSLRALRAHLEFPESSEDVHVEGLPAKLHIYHQREGGTHRIIVQGIRLGVSGISALAMAQGFQFGDDGRIRELRDDELYDYT